MARSLDQIMAELDPYYSGSRTAVKSQLEAAPAQQAADLAATDAKLAQANDNILSSARQRGLGFSGIPVGEQAKYAATEYAPAVANLNAKYVGQKNTLLDALSQNDRAQLTQAQGIFDSERNFAEQQRQFDAQMAEAAKSRAASGFSFGGLGADTGATAAASAPAAARIERKGNGFNFFDSKGRPINAAQFAQLTGTEYRKLLSDMAGAGDKNAQVALKYVGNDFKFGNAPQQVAAALAALGASGSFAKPAAPVKGGTNAGIQPGVYVGSLGLKR